MGFRRSRNLDITFEPGHELHGLRAEVRRLTVAEALDLADLSDNAGDSDGGRELVRRLAAGLRSWNLEDDETGSPISLPGGPLFTEEDSGPAGNYAVLLDQDMQLVLMLARRWVDLALGVPAPLDERSAAGAPSEAGLIPMDDL
jgi:hypothetical protein